MADYRLASLTTKSTPPVPRRRVMQRESCSNNSETRRPHISPPILNQPTSERLRRAQQCSSSTDYRNGSPDLLWTDTQSWVAEGGSNKKKIKNKKPSSQGRPNNRLLQHRTPESHLHFRMQDSEVSIPTPDYPGLEYPPVFEPGTYTLDASTLLPRTQKQTKS